MKFGLVSYNDPCLLGAYCTFQGFETKPIGSLPPWITSSLPLISGSRLKDRFQDMTNTRGPPSSMEKLHGHVDGFMRKGSTSENIG